MADFDDLFAKKDQKKKGTKKFSKINKKTGDQQDEEWHEYGEKDFTGLKIKNLVTEETTHDLDAVTELNENAEVVSPWDKRRSRFSFSSASSCEEGAVGGAYVTPGRRASEGDPSAAMTLLPIKHRRVAPDI